MPLPRGLLKRVIREGYSPPDAMREAWRRVRLEQDPERPAVRVQRKRHAMRRTFGNPFSIYDVFLRGMKIDTVSQSDPSSAEDVKRSLVEHDGYDPEIRVVKRRIRKPRPSRKNPGAAWHEDQERMAEAMEKRETRPRQRTYLKGVADAHALSAHESKKMGLNPRLDYYIRYVTSRQVFEIKDQAGKMLKFSRTKAIDLFSPSLIEKALIYPNTWVQWSGKNPRPSAIPAHKLAAASRYLNLIRNKQKRDYGFAYLIWLKGGAVGHEPEHPGLSVMGAQAVRLQLEGMKLWENPRRARRATRSNPRLKMWLVTYYRQGKEQGHTTVAAQTARTALARAKRDYLHWKSGDTFRVKPYQQNSRGARKNPDVEMTFNTKAKAMRYASAMRKLGHNIEVVKGQYGTYKTIIREPQKNPIAVYNPPTGKIIYGRVLAVEAQKTNGTYKGKRFRHSFTGDSRVAAYAMPDGSVLLKSTAGKRLWQDR